MIGLNSSVERGKPMVVGRDFLGVSFAFALVFDVISVVHVEESKCPDPSDTATFKGFVVTVYCESLNFIR
jgi:hypothetical protein